MAVGEESRLPLDLPNNVVLLNKIEIVDIIYSYDQYIINNNFQKIINKVRANINNWYSHSLTLNGYWLNSLLVQHYSTIGRFLLFLKIS